MGVIAGWSCGIGGCGSAVIVSFCVLPGCYKLAINLGSPIECVE